MSLDSSIAKNGMNGWHIKQLLLITSREIMHVFTKTAMYNIM